MNAQNAWLRNNIFDAMGNYMYLISAKFVCTASQVSPQRLARQSQLEHGKADLDSSPPSKWKNCERSTISVTYMYILHMCRWQNLMWRKSGQGIMQSCLIQVLVCGGDQWRSQHLSLCAIHMNDMGRQNFQFRLEWMSKLLQQHIKFTSSKRPSAEDVQEVKALFAFQLVASTVVCISACVILRLAFYVRIRALIPMYYVYKVKIIIIYEKYDMNYQIKNTTLFVRFNSQRNTSGKPFQPKIYIMDIAPRRSKHSLEPRHADPCPTPGIKTSRSSPGRLLKVVFQ